ncbi:MAG: protease Do [Fluviicola sp.]|jgi:Do/DeqQ family serine protease|uniref:trypsin-like peptidase domain-containing protein n=1 Tax=Fluviicola sp. TaxID=1917219 RepID=UPI0026289E2E|nr:trypsin-like peptidase domain-containing protein [Fluviicola sp.]MDF3026389.1 protease Do [Fluviicola sp.]
MNNSLKYLGLGIAGGMIPFAFGFFLSNNYDTPLSEQVIDGNRLAKTVSYNGMPVEGASFVEASENTINSVVHVTTKVVRTQVQRDPFYEFFYGPGTGGREFKQYGSGSGSGVIVSSEGYIVTNNHVIQDASEIEVILNDNSKYTATVIGTDPSTDIAVLKIDAPGLRPISIGNSDDLRVGEWVLAVGNPFNLTSTVTAGIVSAKARNINLLSDRTSNTNVPIESFIQTDAAVNPGNSGGALVNTKGELIGINTAIASQTGSYSGYSFAVPVNLVNKVMRDIIDFGIVQRAYLGVQIADINQEIKVKNSLPSTRGVFISAVTEDGGADKAGVKKNWVILKVGSREVNSVASLQEEIGKRRPGDKVNLTLRTEDGTEVIKEILLRSVDGETALKSKEEMSKTTALGATFTELTAKEKKELNLSYGVKVKALEPGKLKSSGLTEGDIITKINQTQIESVEQLTRVLNSTKGGILLEIVSESGKKEYVGFGL